ncbi:voltage-gated potassium channel [Neorhodopirellula lusitana]|uniref:Voltage-gated potassium channel n=1 Tax=Neorhodopirellula lusitana TaxID=445327 RepID=A0ABY1QHW0_9BACT|nr:ion transporter [Neorhodopirellula lusitana]SMP69834.1 voltage-gated potassium channel [Neorhodopirellula lusitana]
MSAPKAKPEPKTLNRRLVQRPELPGVRQRMYDIIFEADDDAGRWFDIGLLVAIVASIVLVSIETLPEYQIETTIDGVSNVSLPTWLVAGEWFLTILFTIEYVARLACVRHPLKYAFSFWGIVDLLSIMPSYATALTGESARSFVILRSVRLLRVFRVLKLWRMMSQADELADAVWNSRDKIVVFLAVVLVAVTISGTLMYHIETVMLGDSHDSDFTSIPQAMYWAIVTMTTVGYGDIVPHTTIGKVISAGLILLGYSLIIVPTGFVSAELSGRAPEPREQHPCPQCGAPTHRSDAMYCYRCGNHLDQS